MLTNRLNFKGKTNRLKVSLQNAYFLLFWLIVYFPYISDRNLIILFKFTWNYPAHKIDQLPLLRILSLCMDHSMLTRINSLHLFLLFLLTSLALLGQNDVRINALVCTIVCYVPDLNRLSNVSNDWMHVPIYGSPFNLSAFDL